MLHIPLTQDTKINYRKVTDDAILNPSKKVKWIVSISYCLLLLNEDKTITLINNKNERTEFHPTTTHSVPVKDGIMNKSCGFINTKSKLVLIFSIMYPDTDFAYSDSITIKHSKNNIIIYKPFTDDFDKSIRYDISPDLGKIVNEWLFSETAKVSFYKRVINYFKKYFNNGNST